MNSSYHLYRNNTFTIRAGQRIYFLDISVKGEEIKETSKVSHVVSPMRAGELIRTLFQSIFHTTPTTVWHQQGFMAGASDKQGNELLLDQIDYPSLVTHYTCSEVAA